MAHWCYRSATKVLFESSNRQSASPLSEPKVFGGLRVSQASTQRGRAATRSRFLAPLRFALGMTCYSECYMSLRPTHRDEVDSSVILSAATIGFSSRLATSLPISATEHGVSSVSSLFRLCRSQSTRTRFGRGGSLAPCGRRPPQARGFPRSQVHTPFS